MAAAGWARRPGLDRLRTQNQDTDVRSSTLNALRDLADAIPGYVAGLQTKEKLAVQQRALHQSRGSVVQIGMSTEQVQLRVAERVGEGTFCVVFRGELLSSPSTASVGKAVAAKFVRDYGSLGEALAYPRRGSRAHRLTFPPRNYERPMLHSCATSFACTKG